MSDIDLDALAEAARNRGLKLVRSRVRTPGKRRFGKVGLTDKAGKAGFGMDAKGPIGKPEDAEDYLRKLNARDWGASLDVAAPQRKRTGKKPAGPTRAAANDEPAPKPQPAPKPKPKPKPPPKPEVRDAKPSDSPALVALAALIGAEVEEKGLRKRMAALSKEGLAPLVATRGKDVVGMCAIHRMVTLHREQAVGRISILVVDEAARGEGLGRMLVDAAEERLRKLGCGILEITSNDRLTAAHAFYRHMGYERTSIRFAKTL
jgi:GNAT superfamily N-acetyltransferase